MKLHGSISIGNKSYSKGDVIAWHQVYPFFLIHMLIFGGSGFLMAYAQNGAPVAFLFLHGGFAIAIYTVFYITIFGRDEVKWMFINAGLGLLGIWSQIDWMLSLFGKHSGDYPPYRHIVPFLYYVLYTFLLRNAVLDITNCREDENRKRVVENAYIIISVAAYAVPFILRRMHMWPWG
jgi:hypothetical protein